MEKSPQEKFREYFERRIKIPREDLLHGKITRLRMSNKSLSRSIVRLMKKDKGNIENNFPLATHAFAELHQLMKFNELAMRKRPTQRIEGYSVYDLCIKVEGHWWNLGPVVETYLNRHDSPSRFFQNKSVILKDGEEREFKQFLKGKFCLHQKRRYRIIRFLELTELGKWKRKRVS